MKNLLLSIITLFMAFTLSAQKPKLVEGNWKSLANIEQFDLEFDYSEVEIPEFDKEEDYIAQKMKEKNEDNPGSGAAWREKYFADREMHYEPKFIESFNKRGSKQVSKDFNDSEYILKVNTTNLYHGWNVGVMRKAARIEAEIQIYKRGENKPFFIVKYKKVKGADAMGFDFAIHSRVAEGYAKLAKSFLRDVKKKNK